MSTEDRQQNYLQRDGRRPGVVKPELLTPSIVLIAPRKGGFGESVYCARIALHRPKRGGEVQKPSFWATLLGEVGRLERVIQLFLPISLWSPLVAFAKLRRSMVSVGGDFQRCAPAGFSTGKKNLFVTSNSWRKKTQERLGACYHMVVAQNVFL